MTTERSCILDLAPEAVAEWLRPTGEPAYRLGQILEWTCRRWAGSFAAMTDLPAPLRGRLEESFVLVPLTEIDRRVSADEATGKILFQLRDGEEIETVWMDDGGRFTFCISSQAGCALGCRFCSTGAGGFGRSLSTGEILGQVVALARRTGRLGNIVFMGMGEPLLNTEAVIPALEALADKRRFGLSPRRVTVSTAGIPAGIDQLRQCAVHPNLALSLNSPFDEQRSELMPVNRRYPLDQVLDACAAYAHATGRRMSIEYVLVGGVNTGAAAASAVAEIARRLHALVNVISFNSVPDCGLHGPTQEEVSRFKTALEGRGVAVTERYRRGRDIAAACGQLRGKHPRSHLART